MKKSILLLLLIPAIVFSQDKEYAKQIIKTLCSDTLYGRGYVNDGDRKAASYLASEMQELKLKAFNGEYLQPFEMQINTFPGKITLKADRKKLKPGTDYLIMPNSGSCKGSFEIAWINKKVVNHEGALLGLLSNDLSEYFLAIDTVGIRDSEVLELIQLVLKENMVKAKGVIWMTDNLTWRMSKTASDYIFIHAKRGIITPKNKKIKIDVSNKHFDEYKTNNVVSYIKGEVDTFIVFTAHYDHLGMMGTKTMFPGANDNASGSAMVLDIAKELQKSNNYYSFAFMLFSGEEVGLCGSRHYAANPLFPLEKIKYLYNLDLVGSGEKGITIVNGREFYGTFRKLVDINMKKDYLKIIKPRNAAANSDHYPFYELGVESFFIYTMGSYKEYHNPQDKFENLPLNEYNDLVKLLLDFVEQESR